MPLPIPEKNKFNPHPALWIHSCVWSWAPSDPTCSAPPPVQALALYTPEKWCPKGQPLLPRPSALTVLDSLTVQYAKGPHCGRNQWISFKVTWKFTQVKQKNNWKKFISGPHLDKMIPYFVLWVAAVVFMHQSLPFLFDLSILFLASDSHWHLEAICGEFHLSSSNCLSAPLTTDWSDAIAVNHCDNACSVIFLISFSFSCYVLALCCTHASQQRCMSSAHLLKQIEWMAVRHVSLQGWSPPGLPSVTTSIHIFYGQFCTQAKKGFSFSGLYEFCLLFRSIVEQWPPACNGKVYRWV